MEKKEVIVDTGFLQHLCDNGKNTNGFKQVLSELDYTPVVHPYMDCGEMDMLSYYRTLVEEEYIRVVRYEEFLPDEMDRILYAEYFREIHARFRSYRNAMPGNKKIDPLNIPKGQSILTYRKAGMSLGDVHMVLMASFMQIPVILSDDSDIEILKVVKGEKFNHSTYELEIMGSVDILEKVASKEQTRMSKKDLVQILNGTGYGREKSRIIQAYNKK